MIKGLNDFVQLEPVSHRYYDKEGREYLSVSKLRERFKNKFDRETISRASAKKSGVSQAEILAKWDKKRDDSIDHGNRIHNALELFYKTTAILTENEDLRPMILAMASEYSHYYRVYPEQVLYSTEYMVAGTTDKLLQLTSHPKSIWDIDDYKTNLSKGIQFRNDYNKYMTGPLSHLMDCNYNDYAIQLSTYRYMFEQMTGSKTGSSSIIFVPAYNPLAFYKIPVPYMKLEVIAMLEWHQANPPVIFSQTTDTAYASALTPNWDDL